MAFRPGSGHGFPFPLSLLEPPAAGMGDRSVPRYLARRLRRAARLDGLLSEAAGSLNALAAARAGGRLDPQPPRRAPLSATPSTTRACVSHLAHSIGRHLPAPAEEAICPDGALCELLRTPDLYAVGTAGPAPYVADRLRVTRGELRPQDARLLVGEDARVFLDDPLKYIIRPASSFSGDGPEPIEPYWDPALRQDKRSLDEFIGLLRKAGLVTWRREARSHVGCFFVPKKDSTLRLVLDCRPTNALHRRSPYSDLATPGALANLNLSDEWVQHCEDNSDYDAAVGLEAFGRLDVHGAGVDLKDGFYQFLTPTLSSWFSLGVTYRADEVGIDSVFNEDLQCFEPIAPGEEVWACFAGLPMGWSWALFFCHAAIEEASRRALRSCGLPAATLGDRAPPPRLQRRGGIAAPYVDNANVIGGTAPAAAAISIALRHELESLGFAIHEIVPATAEYEMVGCVLHGDCRVLAHKSKRCWRLY